MPTVTVAGLIFHLLGHMLQVQVKQRDEGEENKAKWKEKKANKLTGYCNKWKE